MNAVWDVFPVVPKLCMKPHPAPQCSYVPFLGSCCKHPAPCHGMQLVVVGQNMSSGLLNGQGNSYAACMAPTIMGSYEHQ